MDFKYDVHIPSNGVHREGFKGWAYCRHFTSSRDSGSRVRNEHTAAVGLQETRGVVSVFITQDPATVKSITNSLRSCTKIMAYATAPDRRFFGLLEALDQIRRGPVESVAQFTGIRAQTDEITCIVLHYKGYADRPAEDPRVNPRLNRLRSSRLS